MTPWPTLEGAAVPPTGRTAPWHRLPPHGARAVWPPAPLAASEPVEGPSFREPVAEPAPTPGLVFDEPELARLTAAAAAAAAAEARRAALQEVAARELATLEDLATTLGALRQVLREDGLTARCQLARVAVAIARAFAVGAPDRASAAVTAMLDGLPEIAAARLVVDPGTAAVLEIRLPDLARRAGFPITLEVDTGGQRAPGAMHLLWDGGWADHDPGEIGRRIAELFAVHAAPQSGGETGDHPQTMLEPAGVEL